MKKLKKEISDREAMDWSLLVFFDSPWKANTAFFFCQTEGYKIEKPFLKLLNDISWWNLTGAVALFWLFFNILDNVFFKPQKDGEEATVLTTTPGVKRSDIIGGKILAFLTFYFIANVLLFLLPFGFYYWWTGVNTSVGWFSLLALWTTIVGPILFFGLIFAPYLFLRAKAKWAGWIASALLAFFPIVWFWGKRIMPVSWTWHYSVENWFFNPVWFIPISLITGIVFLAFFCWHYETQDLK